jgi:hypothetical protein
LKPEIVKHHRAAIGNSMSIVAVIVAVLLGASLFYFATLASAEHSTSSTSSPSSSTSTMQGIIAGSVTVGPSQPACSPNQSCTEDLTGYSIVFSNQCGTSSASCQRQIFTAPIAPSGHYSVLLAPGSYTITGLSPSCSWAGCSSSFPKAVVVEGGQQLIVNISVDTGIR